MRCRNGTAATKWGAGRNLRGPRVVLVHSGRFRVDVGAAVAAAGVVGGGWRSTGWVVLSGWLAGVALALLSMTAVFFGHVVSEPVFAGVASGLWNVFAAVAVGRLARSTKVALTSVAGVQLGVAVVLGLLSLLGRALPEFLVLFAPQVVVALGAAAAAAWSRAESRFAPVWAGIAVGLLGGIVVMLWELGHTGRGVLVAGAVLVAVAAAGLVRRAWHALVLVPLGVAVAVALAQVYALVPAAFDELFPVMAG